MLRLLRTSGEICPDSQNSSVVCSRSGSILRTSGEICPGSQKSSVVCRQRPWEAEDPAHKWRNLAGQPEKFGCVQAKGVDPSHKWRSYSSLEPQFPIGSRVDLFKV